MKIRSRRFLTPCVLTRIDICLLELIVEVWRQIRVAFPQHQLRQLGGVSVTFFVGEHNEKIPRAVLGCRTPTSVYF